MVWDGKNGIKSMNGGKGWDTRNCGVGKWERWVEQGEQEQCGRDRKVGKNESNISYGRNGGIEEGKTIGQIGIHMRPEKMGGWRNREERNWEWDK